MKRGLVIAIGALLLLAVVGGAALVAMDDPALGGSGDDGQGSDRDVNDAEAERVTTETPDMSDTEAAFLFGVDGIEECGNTCRDVTATLHNEGNETATGVVVETTIYTDGDEIWRGEETVGTLAAGDEHTSTRRVELSYADGLKIERNDGWITIETVIRFDDGTEVFTEERQVS